MVAFKARAGVGGEAGRDRQVFTSFIDGGALAPSGRALPMFDPATGMQWADSYLNADAVDAAVESGAAAFADDRWCSNTASERAKLLRKLADLIIENAQDLAALESLANGKPHSATVPEMRAAAQWYQYYASAIEVQGSQQRELSATSDALIVREPLGIVVAITPFNGALSLGSWKVAPALAMGNVVILKPPAEAAASSIELARLALAAGFPKGVLNVVIGDAEIGEKLVRHERVAMISFTGSTAVARAIGAIAGGQLKRFVCEAGGKSAHIVFEDADLQSAVIGATQGVFAASGQTCVAGSRILVHASVLDKFLELYLTAIRRLRLGAPESTSTHLGPIGSKRQLERIRGLVGDAIAAGARILIGGTSPPMEGAQKDGYWFEPTVVAEVGPTAELWNEEVFGPVAVVIPFDTEQEAVALANSSPYGLAAGFWTRDLARIRRVSRQLQAGTVWVNTYRAINVKVPFGGYKQSGIGRENGLEALDEFSQIKSIVIDHGPARNPFDY